MNRTTLSHGLVLLTAGIVASLGFVQHADAASPAVLQLAPGYGGPQEKDGGAGNEQSDVAVFINNGKTYVVTVYMSSNVSQDDTPWQCKCTSAYIDPIVGPVVIEDQVQLTYNGGERPCNHPRIASNGTNYGVWTYGTNEANGNTRTYVQGINEKCELMTDRLRISENDNQNEGAPDIKYIANDWFTAGYLSTANNDLDASYAVGVKGSYVNGAATVDKMWHTKVVAPSNIGRPAISDAGPDKAFFCAAQGNNRPPEQGVACALLDAMNGTVLHKEIIAKSDPANGVYYNQPSIAKLANDRFAVQVLESNGLGKKDNTKGSNTPHLYAYKVSPDTFLQEAYLNKVGKYPTHSSICSGAYGEKGETYVAVMGASITGLGQPAIQFVQYNAGIAFKVDEAMDNWTIGFYGDAGKIANLYGHNPNTQGRDFVRCMGNVPNPGFGVTNGYMSEVETFFLAPHAGNVPGEPKNAGYLSFVPGKVKIVVPPEPPKEQPKTGIAPPDPAETDPGTDPGTDPVTDPGTDPGKDESDDGSISVNGPMAGACSVPSNGSSPVEMAFLALGVGALLAARRRR